MKKILSICFLSLACACFGQSVKQNAWTTNTQANADIYGGTKFVEAINGQMTNATAFAATSNTPAIMVARTSKIMIAATNAGSIPANDTGYIVIGSSQTTNGTGGNIVFPDRGGIWGPQGAGVYFWSDHGAGQPLVIVQGGDIDLIPGEALALQIGATGGGESTRKYLQYSTYELDNANPLGWAAILEGRALAWNGAGYASATHTPGLSFRAANTNDASKHGQFTLWAQVPEWAVGNHTAVPTTAGLDLLTGHPVNGVTLGSTLNVAYGVGWDGSLRVPTMDAIYDKIESLAPGGDGIAKWGGLSDYTSDAVGTNTIFFYNTTEADPGQVTANMGDSFLYSRGSPSVLVMDWLENELFSVTDGLLSVNWDNRTLTKSGGPVADWSADDFRVIARLQTTDFISGGVTLAAIDNDGKLQRAGAAPAALQSTRRDAAGTAWEVFTPQSTTAPGSTTQVLFNDAGAFAGDAGMTYNKTTDKLTVSGGLIAGASVWSGNQTFSPDNTYDIGATGATRPRSLFVATTTTSLNFAAGAAGFMEFTGRSYFTSPADGQLRITSSSGTDFNRLQLGGTSSSFPSIKRNATALNFRLADDSADAPITAAAGTFSGSLSVGGGTAVAKILTATATLNYGSILAAASADLTITVTGAAVNDSVSMGLPAAPEATCTFNAFVSAADTVTIRAFNVGTIAADPASATYRVTVFKY